jgi:hypothetical protein
MIGEAWLIAFGLTGTLLFLAGMLHIPITGATAVVSVIVAVAASILISRPGSRRVESAPGSRAAMLVTVIPIAVVLYAAAFIPLRDFDGRAFWLLKAKGIAHDHAIDGPFFHDQEVSDPRNDYPLLVPLDGAAVFLLGNTYDDTYVRWLHVITFIALVVFVRARAGAWPAALLAWIPQACVGAEGGALSAYNDIALGAFVAGAFFDLIEGERPWRFGMWLAFAALTKNEGLPLALILLAAGAFVYRRRVTAALVPFGAAVASLILWKHRVPHGGEEDLGALLPTFPHQLHRLPGAIAGLARHLASPSWGLFWCAVAVALVALAWQGARREVAIPAFVISAAFLLYVAVYTVTTWVQIDLINSSADRVLLHVVGPGLWVIARFPMRGLQPQKV